MNKTLDFITLLYPDIAIYSAVGGVIGGNFAYITNRPPNQSYRKTLYDIFYVTKYGFTNGFILGLMSPLMIPYITLVSLYDFITYMTDNKPRYKYVSE
jgi:hypothetical protein